ncbi:MAG TPA: hypothetical protein PKJ16_08005 [Spirochaetota bacterium]|nr:hypothetical protein [Spirochaetota bacterium]
MMVIEESVKKKGPRDSGKGKKETILYAYAVMAVLADGTVIEGTASLASPSLTFTHHKNGVAFEKTVRFDDIASIRAIEWKTVGRGEDPGEETRLYHFYPSRWKVVF